MSSRYVWEAGADGATARQLRTELGWLTKSITGYVRFDHLLDEAERRYWENRPNPARPVATVAQEAS